MMRLMRLTLKNLQPSKNGKWLFISRSMKENQVLLKRIDQLANEIAANKEELAQVYQETDEMKQK